MTLLLSIRDLSVRYPGAPEEPSGQALSGISLDLGQGERLAVIGESGSGKSTLALAVAGVLPSGSTMRGSVTWPGLPKPARGGRDIGFVFQDPAGSLDPVMRVGDQVAEVAHANLGLGWKDAARLAVDLLDRVSLPEPEKLARAFPHQLSGGQKQRVAIAAAIAGRPRLLIADEATSALDTIVQAEIMALILRLVAEEGMTLLFISHDIALASQVADRIAVLRRSRMVELGVAAQVVSAPADPYTRLLIDAHLPVLA